MRSQVIILNGVSSVGKSSSAKALQRIAERPFLHVAMDLFLEMLPERMLNHPDGMIFKAVKGTDHPTIAITTGFIVERALQGMRHAIAAMAAQGNHLIVDDVMFDEGEDQAYRALLSGCEVRLIGFFAPLHIIEARERERGDRDIGLARWQFDRVHKGRNYDLEIDACALTPEARATLIKDRFKL